MATEELFRVVKAERHTYKNGAKSKKPWLTSIGLSVHHPLGLRYKPDKKTEPKQKGGYPLAFRTYEQAWDYLMVQSYVQARVPYQIWVAKGEVVCDVEYQLAGMWHAHTAIWWWAMHKKFGGLMPNLQSPFPYYVPAWPGTVICEWLTLKQFIREV